MAKYLTRSSYTTEGIKGLLKDGGTKRRMVIEKAIQALGGKLEAFYFAFGEDDLIAIYELPNNVSAAAGSLAITASGSSRVSVTVLLTPEEIDQAAKVATSITYQAPGQ